VLVGVGLLAAGPAAVAAPAPPVKWPHTLHATKALHRGERLVSANGRFHAAVESGGRLVVRTAAGNRVWNTPKAGSNAYLYLARTGQLVVKVAGRVRWAAGTAGSGKSDVLTMRNDGVLALTSGRALAWSSAIGNRCPSTRGKTFTVDLSAQFARMCNAGQQLRTTPITSGAVSLGAGTPTGTWHVQARVRNTTLYPAAGGAYPVHYWVPYDGAYGIHDSPWQTFAYGSSKYKTQGSHGCIHVPHAAMAWLFGWAPVGTTVAIHA
jgi:hypothetical protein